MPKRASLALLAVVCPAGVECSEAVDDLVLDADRLYCLFRHVVCVCIPRHQHIEIERATGTAASVMPTFVTLELAPVYFFKFGMLNLVCTRI